MGLITLALVCFVTTEVSGHGRLINPFGRDSAWRKYPENFRINYNDNQVFCGGFKTQHEDNGGRCGFCGDDVTHPVPRNHERGGYYATNNIVAQYKQGSIISVDVEITANHYGIFYFDLCVNDDPTARETTACFRQLSPVGVGPDIGYYTLPNTNSGIFTVQLQLPADVTCSYCVLRWRYMAGNSWGCHTTSGGKQECCVGCGTTQEYFYACSDVSVTSSGNEPIPTWTQPNTGYTLYTRIPASVNKTTSASTTTTTVTTTTATTTVTTSTTTVTTTTPTTTTTLPGSDYKGQPIKCPTMCRFYCPNSIYLKICRAFCCTCDQYKHMC